MSAALLEGVARAPVQGPALSVRNLVTEYFARDGVVRAVDDVSWDVHAGRTLCVVGESGSGKTAMLQSVLGLIPPRSGAVRSGSVLLDGREVLGIAPKELRRIRGNEVSLIPQDPAAALNPLLPVGEQISDVVRAHSRVGRRPAAARARELLTRVGLPDAGARARQYPHQFSGGLLQRVTIAMAIAHEPRVLLADEPTTALDVTVQAQVLELLEGMQAESGMAIVFVTHDLGVVAEVADEVVVMYAGRVLEVGEAAAVLGSPRHPYTQALLSSVPGLLGRGERLEPIPGQPPVLTDRPAGCLFRLRCRLCDNREVCSTTCPSLEGTDGHKSACHFQEELTASDAPRVGPARARMLLRSAGTAGEG